jgi:hypothetical protein
MSLEVFIIFSFLFTSVFGVLFHFAHKRFLKSLLVHIFCPVNESVWEHSKLTFSPMVVAGIAQVLFFYDYHSNLYFSIFVSILVGIIIMPIIYYAIQSIIKKEILWVSITIFYVVVIISYLVEYFMLKNNITISGIDVEIFSLIAIFCLIAVYGLLTFFPPKLGIFKDSIKKKYGDFK